MKPLTPEQELSKLKSDTSYGGGSSYGRTPNGIVDLKTNKIVTGVTDPSLTKRYDTLGNVSFIGNTDLNPENPNSSSTNPLVSRMNAQDSSNPQNDLNTNPAYNVAKPDEATIREQTRQRVQANIDAIRGTADAVISRQREAKDALERKTYFNNIAAGLGGSNVGAGKEAQAGAEGEAKVAETEKARDEAIAQALAGADTRASEQFQTEMANYINSAKDKYTAQQTLDEKIKSEATKELTAFATKYPSYEEFVGAVGEPKVQQYMKETGLDKTSLQSYFLNSNKANLVSDKPEIIGDQAIWFSKKSDGTISKITVDLPKNTDPKNSDVVNRDDGIYVINKIPNADGTYTTTRVGGVPKSSTSNISGEQLKQQINKAIATDKDFQNGSPEQQASYIRSLGGTPSDFGY